MTKDSARERGAGAGLVEVAVGEAGPGAAAPVEEEAMQ